MHFEYVVTDKCGSGFFTITKDPCLLYSTEVGGFSVLLGGDWRYELNVSSATGQCVGFLGTLVGNIQEKSLEIPPHCKGDVFFYHDEELLPGVGCHYLPIANHAYYDPEQKILCVGDPDSAGTAIEFTENIVMIISDNVLPAVYLNLKNAHWEIPCRCLTQMARLR